jgi:hypothetical protein
MKIYILFIILLILIIIILYELFYCNIESLTNVLNNPQQLPLTGYNTKFNSYYYDQNNYNIQYHDLNNYESEGKGIWLKDQKGELKYIEWTDISNYSTYFIPGAFPYGPSNYVPSYKDSVYFRYNTDKKNVIYTK